MKQCSKCGETKPITEYHRDKNTKDGYVQSCKSCVKIKSQKWLENNRQYNKLKCKQNYNAKPQEYKNRTLKWFKENPDLKKANDKKYQIEHPEVYRLSRHRYKTRKLQNGVFDISKKEWQKIYSSPCIYCGSTEKIQADHVIPIAKGGTHSIGNLVPACQPCNGSKRERTITEWKKAKRKAAGNLQPATFQP